MQLLMTWPTTGSAFTLNEAYSVDRPACFNVLSGRFDEAQPVDAAWFYLTADGPVIFNTCQTVVCLVDGVEIAEGQRQLLKPGSVIQLGHFTFEILASTERAVQEALLHSLLDLQNDEENPGYTVPEIDAILPNGGHYTGDLRYFNDVPEADEAEPDVLKKLEVEYKKFLIWGEQNRNFFDKGAGLNNKLPGSDACFEAVREEMKARTLTECIIEAPSLIDKVWEELKIEESDNSLLGEEEKTDILKALAPDNIASREKQPVPELVFQDLYKIGLDSLY